MNLLFISLNAPLIFLQANSVLIVLPSKTITGFKGFSWGGVLDGVQGDKAAEEAVIAGVHGTLSWKYGKLGGLAVNRHRFFAIWLKVNKSLRLSHCNLNLTKMG